VGARRVDERAEELRVPGTSGEAGARELRMPLHSDREGVRAVLDGLDQAFVVGCADAPVHADAGHRLMVP